VRSGHAGAGVQLDHHGQLVIHEAVQHERRAESTPSWTALRRCCSEGSATRPAPAHEFGRIDVTRDEVQAQAPKEPEKKLPARGCKLLSGPTYPPGARYLAREIKDGRQKASFDLAAKFAKDAGAGNDPACCEVRQYIKWDEAYEKDNGGPPHSGFPASAKHSTWHEDRNRSDKRFGHRSGPHSQPWPDCWDEYKTGDARDQANGDTYCGHDEPTAPESRKGEFQFKLTAIDRCNGDAEKAAGPIVTLDWG
jgi:hypothetical protein